MFLKTLLLIAPLVLWGPPVAGQAAKADLNQHGAGPAVFRVSTAALLLSGQTGGAINTAVTATATRQEDDKYKVLVLTEVDPRGLEPPIESGPVTIEVFVYLLNASGDVAAKTSQIFDLDTARFSSEKAAKGLKVILPVDVASGRYRVRSLVTLQGEEGFGLQSTGITLLTRDKTDPQLISATLLDTAFGWFLAVPEGGLASFQSPLSGSPLIEAPQLAAARPVVLSEGQLIGSALARNLPVAQSQIAARIYRPDGTVEAEVSADIIQRATMPGGDLETVLFSLQIPALFPSQYSVGLFSERLQPTADTSCEFLVAEPNSSEAYLSWTQIDSYSAAITPPPRRDPTELGETTKQIRKIDETVVDIEAIYREVIEHLAAGNQTKGQNILREFEVEALALKSPEAMTDLEKKEAQVLKTLAGGSWTRLLPFTIVYAELIRDYDSRGLSTLAEHALSMSTQLAEPIARKAKKPADKKIAAGILVSVGGYAIVGHRSGVGEELLQGAIKLDPTNAAALLSLGALYEQKGRYQEAVETLASLVKRTPGHREARLRLAVNLNREGHSNQSKEVLTALVAESIHDWVGLVAIQELANFYSSQDRRDEAIMLLEGAIDSWPDQPSLVIQLAWLLDAAEGFDQARELVEALLTSTSAPSGSARYRYNHWYSYIFDSSRQSLSEIVEQRATELSLSHFDPKSSTGL